MDYKLFKGPQQATNRKYPQVSGVPQNTASDSYYYPQKLAGMPNSIQKDQFAMPDNYFGNGGNEIQNYEPKPGYHGDQGIDFYQGRTDNYPQEPQEFQQNLYQNGFNFNGQGETYEFEGGNQFIDNQYYPDAGNQGFNSQGHQWNDWQHDQGNNPIGQNYTNQQDQYQNNRQEYWGQPKYYNNKGYNGYNNQGQGKFGNQHNKRNQKNHYNNYGNNQQGYNGKDGYHNNHYQHNTNRYQNKHDKGLANNLNFNYRIRADGQLFSLSQLPAQLTFTKNLIPDISAFSRSEPSIEVRRRKKSFSDSDLVAELSDLHSEDIENSKRKRNLKGRILQRNKSNDDLQFSDLANIKIEGLIQRKLGIKTQEKKSQPNTITDKQSKRSDLALQADSKANDKKPGFNKATDSNVNVGPTPERKADKKGLPEKKASPTEKSKLDKNKNDKNKNEKNKKNDDKVVAQKKNNKDQNELLDGEVAHKTKYNKTKVVSILEDLILTGRFDSSKVKFFDKFDSELGKIVKYVRIEIPRQNLNNDHFISLKPEGAQQKHGADLNEDRRYGYNTQEKKNVEQGYGQSQLQSKIAEVKLLATTQMNEEAALDESQMTLSEQAMHKTMTGKLQRHIRKMNDEEKISLFRQLKSNLHELATNVFGRYVLVLLLKTNIIAIVDALISYFDKRIMDLITHKNGLLLCQNLIDLKFKDVRLRRSLKRIDRSLKELMADEIAPSVILIYANQLPSSDLEDFVEFCKTEYQVCLNNPVACKIFAKVYSKASDVDRLEIELNLKTIMPQIFDGNYGKELVEIFFTKADPQNLLPLKKKLFEYLEKYLTSEEYDYFFSKVVELKRTDLIDSVLNRLFKDGVYADSRVTEILNHETGYKVILSFFTLASLGAKDLMRGKLNELRTAQEGTFNSFGKKVLSLCDSYFSAPSK